jgi:hypothetical protein
VDHVSTKRNSELKRRLGWLNASSVMPVVDGKVRESSDVFDHDRELLSTLDPKRVSLEVARFEKFVDLVAGAGWRECDGGASAAPWPWPLDCTWHHAWTQMRLIELQHPWEGRDTTFTDDSSEGGENIGGDQNVCSDEYGGKRCDQHHLNGGLYVVHLEDLRDEFAEMQSCAFPDLVGNARVKDVADVHRNAKEGQLSGNSSASDSGAGNGSAQKSGVEIKRIGDGANSNEGREREGRDRQNVQSDTSSVPSRHQGPQLSAWVPSPSQLRSLAPHAIAKAIEYLREDYVCLDYPIP